jgi:hypothetical protein
MERSVPRIGSRAGLVAVAGIVGYHLSLTALAGQRVSGVIDASAIRTFYGHPVVAVLGISQFLMVIPFLVFAVALRETLVPGGSGSVRVLANVGVAAAVAEVPVVLTEIAAQAGLVAAVERGEPVAGLFRFWDALYNSGMYAIEATWVLAFGLALHAVLGARSMRWLSIVTATLLGINVFAIWLGIPDVATLPSAVAVAVWLVLASLSLWRASASPLTATASVSEPRRDGDRP